MSKKNANELNNINDLAQWISEGRQIGFTYGEKSYCIGYGAYADNQGYISLTELGSGASHGNFIDLDEFLTYSRVPGGFVAEIWPVATDIKFFVPKGVAQ